MLDKMTGISAVYFFIFLNIIRFDLSCCANKPNILLILNDDQDLLLSGMDPLLKTQKIMKNGIRFNNMFVTSPLCCPSRSSILVGRYMHNHGVVNNSINGNCNSRFWQEKFENFTFVNYLKSSGYSTFYAGKYLNQYGMHSVGGVSHVPPGWDSWNALVGNSCYYNYSLSIDGKEEKHGYEDKDYLTDVLFHKSMEYLLSYDKSKPFFMMIAPPSPHSPFMPAPRHKKIPVNASTPHTPNFNIQIDKSKHWLLRQPPFPLPQKVLYDIDEIFKNRWRTLLSVDDGFENLFFLLVKLGLSESTYIFFTSDNGFHLGQFSLPWDKRQMYEFDIRVPLLVRGPNIQKQTIDFPVLNIDLAPTFLSLAGSVPPTEMDGISFASYFDSAHPKKKKGRKFLIEHDGEATETLIFGCPQYTVGEVHTCEIDCICEDSWNNTYICIRSCCAEENSIYCQFHDHENFIEYYNLTADPYQLRNLYRIEDFHMYSHHVHSLSKLNKCRGSSCSSFSEM